MTSRRSPLDSTPLSTKWAKLNAQHQAGFGLDGGTGRNLFQYSLSGAPPAGAARSVAVSVDVAGAPQRIGASSALAQVPGNGENARQLARVFESQVASGGTRTPAEAYADLVGDIGLRKSSAMEELELREVAEAQFFELKESHGGVSLDEEMVNLTKYQRAYQAASKVLTTVDEMLNELLTRLR